MTWYDRRGAGYWTRRAGMGLVMLIPAAVATAVITAVLIAFHHRSLAAFTVVLVLEADYSLASLAFLAVLTVRTWNDPRPAAVRAGSVPGQVFLVLGLLTAGPYLYLALSWMLPETPPERAARLKVAGQLRGRGCAAPGT